MVAQPLLEFRRPLVQLDRPGVGVQLVLLGERRALACTGHLTDLVCRASSSAALDGQGGQLHYPIDNVIWGVVIIPHGRLRSRGHGVDLLAPPEHGGPGSRSKRRAPT
jgi:hypothetical protein